MIKCEYCNTEIQDNTIMCICGMYVKKNIPQQDIDQAIKSNAKSPNIIEKASNFANSIIKHVSNGMIKVSDSVKQERMAICRACPFFNASDPKNPTCNQCGCFLDIKTGWASEKCPEDKWLEVKTQSSGGCGCQKS